MDPSNSRSGQRFVAAPKNNFLNLVFQKEEARASREFNGWSSLSRTRSDTPDSKTATRLGFGESSVKIRKRPQSATNVRKPPLGLTFTVKRQQPKGRTHVPKRFNLGPAVSLSSSSQVSMLLRRGPLGSENGGAIPSPDKKTLNKWRRELQRELRRVDQQIGQNTASETLENTMKMTIQQVPQTDDIISAVASASILAAPEQQSVEETGKQVIEQVTEQKIQTIEANVQPQQESNGNSNRNRTTSPNMKIQWDDSYEDDEDATIITKEDILKQTLALKRSVSPNLGYASDEDVTIRNDIANDPEVAALISPTNNNTTTAMDSITSSDNTNTNIVTSTIRQRPASALSSRRSNRSVRSARPGSARRTRSDLVPNAVTETIKSAKYTPRPSSARSSRSRAMNSSRRSPINLVDNLQPGQSPVGSARQAIQAARRQRPSSAASQRTSLSLLSSRSRKVDTDWEIPPKSFASEMLELNEAQSKSTKSTKSVSNVMSVSKLNKNALYPNRTKTPNSTSGRKSKGSRSSGNLHRRAPSRSGGSNPLGSGMWYVWDPLRKKGSMRGGRSAPRVAGFKNTFQTTSSYDFNKSLSARNGVGMSLKVPRHGRRKTMLR